MRVSLRGIHISSCGSNSSFFTDSSSPSSFDWTTYQDARDPWWCTPHSFFVTPGRRDGDSRIRRRERSRSNSWRSMASSLCQSSITFFSFDDHSFSFIVSRSLRITTAITSLEFAESGLNRSDGRLIRRSTSRSDPSPFDLLLSLFPQLTTVLERDLMFSGLRI